MTDLLLVAALGLASPVRASAEIPTEASAATVAQAAALTRSVQVTLSMQVRNPSAAREAVLAQVTTLKGEASTDYLYGEGADLTFEIPAASVEAFVAWAATLGHVTDQRIESVERSASVGLLEIDGKRAALAALRRQLDGAGADQVLQIESEMQRLIGEIRDLESQSSAAPAADRASVTLSLTTGESDDHNTILHPGVHASGWFMGGPDGVDTRLGAGITLNFVRAFTAEVDLSPKDAKSPGAFVITLGGGAFSHHLGSGERVLLNPYLGLRLGYGYIDVTHRFLAQGDVGLELVRWHDFIVDVWGRPTLDCGKDALSTGIQAGGSVVFPF